MEEEYLWMLELWPPEDSPAQKAMRDIKKKDPILHEFITHRIRRLMKLEIGQLLKSKDLKGLKNGLWELVISTRKGEFRMLGKLEHPNRFQPQFKCFHCFRKKEQKLRNGRIKIALERLKMYNNNKYEIH